MTTNSSITLRLKDSSLAMKPNYLYAITTINKNSVTVDSLNALDNFNLKYCKSPGLLHTDNLGDVTTKLISTDDIIALAVTSDKLANNVNLLGVPTAPTAAQTTNTVQIATTAFVHDCLNINRTANEDITGVKTFSTLPVLVPLNVVGIVHNDASGNLSTKLIQTADIADAAITFAKLDANLVLPFNTTLDVSSVNTDSKAIVTKGFLAASIKPFTDTLSNEQPVRPIGFFHINANNISSVLSLDPITLVSRVNPVFILSNNIRYIVDDPTKILLPAIAVGGIAVEGIFYSVINKSGSTIVISTASVDELIFNCFVAPEGDNDFNLDPNQCLEFISIVSNGISSWQAQYY